VDPRDRGSVKQVLNLPSPGYRSPVPTTSPRRVPKVSTRNRSQSEKHLPNPHTAAPEFEGKFDPQSDPHGLRLRGMTMDPRGAYVLARGIRLDPGGPIWIHSPRTLNPWVQGSSPWGRTKTNVLVRGHLLSGVDSSNLE
jgi:hypothetical protein